MSSSDWSSDVCSSDLDAGGARLGRDDRLRLGAVAHATGEAAGGAQYRRVPAADGQADALAAVAGARFVRRRLGDPALQPVRARRGVAGHETPVAGRRAPRLHRTLRRLGQRDQRSEEHTSELQSLMRLSYAVFCLKTKNK